VVIETIFKLSLTEAVKKMNTHNGSTNAQIAAPIKTYLSGAPSRLFEKSKLNQEKIVKL
jgi:hypothetical protein